MTVLCPPEREADMAAHILAETTTNGLRVRRCGKYSLAPSFDQVQTPWGAVRIKRAEGYGVTHIKPEYEDVAKIAAEQGVPLSRVLSEVLHSRKEDV